MKATLELDGHTFDVHLVKAGPGWTAEVDGQAFTARLAPNGTGCLVTVGKQTFHVQLGNGQAIIDGATADYRIHAVRGDSAALPGAASNVTYIRPPMNGKLDRIAVAVGQQVNKGEVLFVLEAMKMQNEVRSPTAGRITAIHLGAGATVEPKQIVLELQSG